MDDGLASGGRVVKFPAGVLGMAVTPKVDDTRPGVGVWVVREVDWEVVDREDAVESGVLAVVLGVDRKSTGLEGGTWDGVEDTSTVVMRGKADEGKDVVSGGETEALM